AELAAGPAVTALGGLGAAAMAVADWRAIDGPGLAERATSTASGAAVGLAGLLAIVVWSAVLGGVYRSVAGDVGPSTGAVLSSLALGIATVSVAWGYLQGTGRGLEFVDVRRPDRRDAGYVVAGLAAAVGLNLGIEALFRAVGLASARHSLYDVARHDPGMLLVLIPLTILLIGPGEELLYRNVVQKSLYDAFSRPGAVVVASAIFAAAHVPAYSSAGATPLSVLNTLTIVFVLAVVLGVAYDRTRNVLVSALIHGGFNAIAFAATYVELVG
ncbi:MAG: lysostaphin resistance A-like protein, partial [Halobacteriales archaeon]